MNENMIELLTLKVAAGGKMLASLIPGSIPVMLAANGIVDGETGLSLAIVGSVVGGAWYLNGRLTRIEDGLRELRRDMVKLPCGSGHCTEGYE